MQSPDDEAVPSTPPGGWPDSFSAANSQVDPIKANIAEALHDRRDEYLVQKKIKIKVGTWNVASTSGTEKDLKNWFVKEKEITDHLASLRLEEKAECSENARNADILSEDDGQAGKHDPSKEDVHSESSEEAQEIGLYVIGLQEIVDISSPALLLNPYVDPAPAQKWRDAVEEALPLGYQSVAQQQLIGLYLMVYASPLVKPIVSDVSTVSVATGGLGWTGNKGAVAVRIFLGGTTRMLFVNSHLTAGNEKTNLDRRNWDVAQILSRAKFPAVVNELMPTEAVSEAIGDEDFAFWFGDLNYRLDGIPGDDVRRLLTLHTRGEYGQDRSLPSEISNLAYGESTSEVQTTSHASDRPPSSITLVDDEGKPAPSEISPAYEEQSEFSTDPTSLQTTIASLLPHDQLHNQIDRQKAFHDGWQEGDIRFPPTYKYDIGTLNTFDSSEKMRGPSWCDRILFRSKKRKQALELQRAVAEVPNPKLELQPSGVLFDYNPDEDEEETPANQPDQQNSDDINLHNYSSHQKITSSDHKPLQAIFTIRFHAEDQTSKDKVYWKVARMFDEAENENRPRVTIVSNPKPFTGNRTIDFGSIKYGEIHSNELTIANTGTKDATIRIVHTNDQPPSWLSIVGPSHAANTLAIGDVLTLNMQFCITDREFAWCLNGGKELLEHVLVVKVEDGADYFVSVRAKWVPFNWAA